VDKRILSFRFTIFNDGGASIEVSELKPSNYWYCIERGYLTRDQVEEFYIYLGEALDIPYSHREDLPEASANLTNLGGSSP